MTLKPNLKLRKVGNRFMLVDVSEHDLNVMAVHTLNETAAFVWKSAMICGIDIPAIAGLLCQDYDVLYEVAEADVRRLVSEWLASGLIR